MGIVNCHYIYGWFDISTQKYFYIGAGKHQKNSRYPRSIATHYYGSSTNNKLARCENKRRSIGENFVIHILADNLDLYERTRIEQLYISVYKTIDNGGCLYNHTKGGDYNPMFDEDIRKKHKERVNTKEYKDNMSKIKLASVNPMKDPENVKKCNESRLRNLNSKITKKEGDI